MLSQGGDGAFERLSTGTAICLSHSKAGKRMVLFKATIWGRYRRGGWGDSFRAGLVVSSRSRSLAVSFERGADIQDGSNSFVVISKTIYFYYNQLIF